VNNTVAATAFKDIKAPRPHGEREENAPEKGLRVSDKGFMNTAVISSTITYIDGEAGGTSLRFPTSFIIIADDTSTSIQVLYHEFELLICC
jgi:citrate synthase